MSDFKVCKSQNKSGIVQEQEIPVAQSCPEDTTLVGFRSITPEIPIHNHDLGLSFYGDSDGSRMTGGGLRLIFNLGRTAVTSKPGDFLKTPTESETPAQDVSTETSDE